MQALLSSLRTPTTQHRVPTRTESDAGRMVLTQQTQFPRHSTGLDCSESGFSYQCMFSACGSTSLQWLKQHEYVTCVPEVCYMDCGFTMAHATCAIYVPEGNSLDGLLTVGPTEGGESGGGWLSTTRGLLEANFFAAVADV